MSEVIKDKKLYFIVNPASGGGTAVASWDAALPVLDKAGYTYGWEYTRPGYIGQQVQHAVKEEGAQVIVAVGGDGTLYDILNGIISDDKLISEDLILAVYPTGSACDFSRSIYPGGKCDLLQLLEKADTQKIDIGRCCFATGEVKYFINSFDIGAGADTCAAVNENSGKVKRFWRNGHLAFKLTALKVLMGFDYTVTDIQLADRQFSGEYIIMGCGNGAFIGGGMKLFPDALLSDGKLDLLLIPKMSRLSILRMFSKVYDGSIREISGTQYVQTDRVKFSCQRSVAAELDGEIPGHTDLEISVLPKALSLLLPVL